MRVNKSDIRENRRPICTVTADQRGMSLVELLVAITILAIIVAPFLHSFVTGARINQRARKNLNAVMLAEDIMEGLKAHDFEEIDQQFSDGSGSVSFNIVDRTLIAGGAGKINASAVPGGIDEEGVSYFYIDNAETEPSIYDALIRLDARPYRSGKRVAVGGTEEQEYNSKEVAVLQAIGDQDTASCSQTSNQAFNVMKEWYMETGTDDPSIPAEDVFLKDYSYLDRTITIDLNDLKVTNTYDIVKNGALKYDDIAVKEETVIYPGRSSGDAPKNFFLFYYPLYVTLGGQAHDHIVIKGSNNETTVYIVKQEQTTTTNTTGLLINENQYKADVKVTDSSTGTDVYTRIRTNLNYNLAAEYFPTILDSEKYPSQATFDVNGVADLAKLKDDGIVKDLVGSETRDRYFDVKIIIYPKEYYDGGSISGSVEEVYDIDGSTQE